ncbi:MAG: ABC transporter ATP-binding protein [Clostridiaceae bacterium]|nr:ABC transporter ATP-binding protein [Clostridiaceae bacterium]
MLRLIRYLRPFVGAILLIFALLFVQAMTDLELPDYMSNIVNIGIQQNGIDKPVPSVLRQSVMEHLLLLMPAGDADEIKANMTLLDRTQMSSQAYEAALKQYPLIVDETLYELKPDAVISDSASAALAKALTMLSAIEQIQENGTSSLGSGDSMLANLPAGSDIFQILAQLPAAQRQQMLDQAEEKMTGLTDSILRQTAITRISAEYKAIGLDIAAIQSGYVLRTGGIMLLIALIGAVCSILVGLLAARVAAGLSRNLRLAVFSQVEHFSSAEFDTFSTASLITRSTNDIQQVQMTLVMLLRILFYAPILGTGGVIKVINSDVSMGWIIALAVSILMTLIIVMFIIAIPRFKKVQKLVDRLNLVTREILTGMMVIRAFNTQRHQDEKFDAANQDLTRINLFISRLMALLMPMMMLIMNGITLLIVWVGAKQVDLGSMQVGDIMAFMQYTMQIIMSFLMVSMVFIMLPRASVSGQRIAEVLAVKPQINDPDTILPFDPAKRGKVVFDHVYFRYPNADDDVLTDITFTAQPGETTALIGSTGCGKSTVVNLIPRFYDVTGGQILIDGVDVRQVRQHDLRERIGYVAQKGVLFTGSIQDNIRYGRPEASPDETRQAAQTAQALDFIEASEAGFDTPISQGGTNVSGGQKQRLSIARALIKRPEIYIFDDTFSALDYQTDTALRKALRQQTGHATVLIVAQRIGTIRHADQIIVLDQGKIVGKGTHDELLKSCPVYLEIASSQLSEEELAL